MSEELESEELHEVCTEATARWLTPPEQEAWIALVGVLVKLPPALDAQLAHDAGLNTFEYFCLAGLSHRPDRTMNMSDLAVFTNGSLSRLSHVVKRLEAKGWVRREPCPGNARYTHAILTDAGWDKVVATAPGHVEAVRSLVFDALSEAQVRQLKEIGEAVLARVDPGRPAQSLGSRDRTDHAC